MVILLYITGCGEKTKEYWTRKYFWWLNHGWCFYDLPGNKLKVSLSNLHPWSHSQKQWTDILLKIRHMTFKREDTSNNIFRSFKITLVAYSFS